MAPHSNPLAWKMPWMEEPGVLQSMGLQRVRHDLATEQQQEFGLQFDPETKPLARQAEQRRGHRE